MVTSIVFGEHHCFKPSREARAVITSHGGVGIPLKEGGFSLQNTDIAIGSAGRLLGELPFHCSTAGDIFKYVFNYYFAPACVTMQNANWC